MTQAHNENRVPTKDEIRREQLHLDAYGMTTSKLADRYPVAVSYNITKQAIVGPLIRAMAEDGWAWAGAGYFSAVFVKGGLALKIGLKVTDTGAVYAAWCRSNQGKPGVPKVYAIGKFASCYVVLTRRYTPCDRCPDEDPELNELMYAINTGAQEPTEFGTVLTAQSIRAFFEGVASFDLHEQNVMLDEHGNVVITDPISYGPCSGTVGNTYTYTDANTRLAA